tara:strand:- start:999 stop:1691 length:693 start_codon:yes stop_codon:yes gene_type:complete
MSGLEICFTGFAKQDRAQLEELATDSGFIVRKDVTKNLHMLCTGKNAGPKKVNKAHTDGAAIFDEAAFIALVQTGELSTENYQKLGELIHKREQTVKRYQFEKYQAHFSVDFLESEIQRMKRHCFTLKPIPFADHREKINLSDVYVCFTGVFECCNTVNEREIIEGVTAYKGAYIDNQVTLRTKYLVVGNNDVELKTTDQLSSKTYKALELREQGHNIYIISEDQWLAAI